MDESMMDLGGTVGQCEWCGVVDHHLVDGECVQCHKLTEYRQAARVHRLTPPTWPERRDQRRAAVRRLVAVGNRMALALEEEIEKQRLPHFILDMSLLNSWEQALADLRSTLPQAQRNHTLCQRK